MDTKNIPREKDGGRVSTLKQRAPRGHSSSWNRRLLRRALLSSAATPGAPTLSAAAAFQARGLGGLVFAWAQVREARAYGVRGPQAQCSLWSPAVKPPHCAVGV